MINAISRVNHGGVRWAREAAASLLDLAYPRDCLITGEAVPAPGDFLYLSAAAVRDLQFIEAPHCRRCGFPFFGVVEGPRDCPHCRELRPVFGEGRSLLVLKGPVRRLVYTLKYHQGRHVLPDIRTLIRSHPHFTDFLADARLVPVPLHPRKERHRGFNQSRLLAETMAEIVKTARVEDVLRRIRETPSQTRMDRTRREKNVKNAFALRPGFTLDSSIRYVLVDDVFTTGATLNACAKVLRNARAARVDVATFGHG